MMIALKDIKPGAEVTMGGAPYIVRLNAGTVMVLTRDEEDVEVTHNEVRRLGMTVTVQRDGARVPETAY